MLALGFIVLFAGMLLGLPLFLAFGMQAIIHSAGYIKVPMQTVPQMMFGALDHYVLLAIVYYLLAAFILQRARLTDLLIDMVNSWVGHVRCGLAWAMCLATLIFGALTASAGAVISVIGVVMVPRMVAAGYPKRFCLALICSVNQTAVLIPPSITFIVYGYVTETSVAALFIAGIIPGIVFMLINGMTAAILEWRASRRGEVWGRMPAASWKERGSSLVKALPVMTFAVIILGGIYGGFFSVTEAALVGTLYAAILALCYRRFNFTMWRDVCRESLRIKGMLFLLVAAVVVFARVMTYARFPHYITEWVTGMGLSLNWFIFAILLLYICIGLFAEALVILFVTVPILFPVVTAVGVDPIHFGVIIVLAIGVASTTPPVGGSIFSASAIFDEPAGPLFVAVMPFNFAQIAVLFIIAYIPALSLWLPGLAGLT